MRRLFLILSLLFFTFSTNAQIASPRNHIKIKARDGKYEVSGYVDSAAIKTEVIEKLKARFGVSIDFSELKAGEMLTPVVLWLPDFDRFVEKLKNKNFSNGLVLYRPRPFVASLVVPNPEYPELPDDLSQAPTFLLDSKQQIKLADYSNTNKVVVFFLFATWCRPCWLLADDMQALYAADKTGRLEIIALEADPDEIGDLGLIKTFVKRHGYKYKVGYAEKEFYKAVQNETHFNAIPQSFLIYKGKLIAVFAGGGKNSEKIKSEAFKILSEYSN